MQYINKKIVMLGGAALILAAGLLGTLSVQAANAPTVTNGTTIVNENGSTTGTLMANDTNYPLLPLTYSIVTYPADGTLSNLSSASGTFTYTPNSGFVGDDSFTFMVNNGSASSTTGTETVMVDAASSTTSSTTSTASTTAPIVTNSTLNVTENGSVTGTLVASDTNSPVLPLSFTIVTYPSEGTLSNWSNSSGTFTYTPNSGFVGNDSFTFSVSNGSASSTTGMETLIVGAASSTATSTASTTAPLITNGTLSVTENTSATGMLMASDTNSPALPLSFWIISNPMNGSLSNLATSTGSFTYTPNNGFVGNDSFTFGVSNGVTSSTTGMETIMVNAASSTASSTDLTAMETEIQQLEQEILALLQQVLAGKTTVTTGGNGSSTTQTMGAAMIEPQNPTVTAGTSIDFGGRNFAPNELVTITSNGQTVTTAQADGGGNFSTGSLPISSSASGTQTYTFTGQTSGTVLTDTITIAGNGNSNNSGTTTSSTTASSTTNTSSTASIWANNGNIAVSSVTGASSSVVAGNTVTVTPYLVSQNGANANSVTVDVQLLDSNGTVVANTSYPGQNVLHESPQAYPLTTGTTLSPGTYTIAVSVWNADGTQNASFPNLGTVVVTSS